MGSRPRASVARSARSLPFSMQLADPTHRGFVWALQEENGVGRRHASNQEISLVHLCRRGWVEREGGDGPDKSCFGSRQQSFDRKHPGKGTLLGPRSRSNGYLLIFNPRMHGLASCQVVDDSRETDTQMIDCR